MIYHQQPRSFLRNSAPHLETQLKPCGESLSEHGEAGHWAASRYMAQTCLEDPIAFLHMIFWPELALVLLAQSLADGGSSDMALAPGIHLQCAVVYIYIHTIDTYVHAAWIYTHTDISFPFCSFICEPVTAAMNLHDLSTLVLGLGCILYTYFVCIYIYIHISPAHWCKLADEATNDKSCCTKRFVLPGHTLTRFNRLDAINYIYIYIHMYVYIYI